MNLRKKSQSLCVQRTDYPHTIGHLGTNLILGKLRFGALQHVPICWRFHTSRRMVSLHSTFGSVLLIRSEDSFFYSLSYTLHAPVFPPETAQLLIKAKLLLPDFDFKSASTVGSSTSFFFPTKQSKNDIFLKLTNFE